MKPYQLFAYSVLLLGIGATPGSASEQTLNHSYLKSDVSFGQALAGIGDVNGDSVPDIAVSGNQEQAFVFSGADGALLYTLDNPYPQTHRGFGCSLAGVGDISGDSVPDIAVGSHPHYGGTFLFSGAEGAFLYMLEGPNPSPEADINADCSLAETGNINGEAVVGDVNGDSIPDIAVGGDSPQGQAFVFSGADGTLLYTLENPNPQTNTRLLNDSLYFSPNNINLCGLTTKYVTTGGWRTLESFWNARGTAFFRTPAGAEIKVRYGVGWLGSDGQKQTLNGEDYKKLEVGAWSLTYARMQMRVSNSTYVTYVICPGGIGIDFPPIRF